MSKLSARLLIPFSILIFEILFVVPVFAKIEVNNSPSKIEINKDFELDVALSNLTDPTHYLSIALHKNSGDAYFGQTQNGGNWIEADDGNCKNFHSATISEGSWSGKLKGKINYNEKDFDNSLGNYLLKVFKYTDSCNKSASEDMTVELFDPNPPPTVTPSPKPTVISTNAPAPTVTAKPANSPTIYISPTIKKAIPTITNTENISSGEVLGETSNPTVTPDEVKPTTVSETKNKSFPVFGLLLGGGILFIAAAIVISVRQIKNSQKGG